MGRGLGQIAQRVREYSQKLRQTWRASYNAPFFAIIGIEYIRDFKTKPPQLFY